MKWNLARYLVSGPNLHIQNPTMPKWTRNNFSTVHLYQCFSYPPHPPYTKVQHLMHEALWHLMHCILQSKFEDAAATPQWEWFGWMFGDELGHILMRVIPKLELRSSLRRFPNQTLGVRLAEVAFICQGMSIPNHGSFKVSLEHRQGHQSETPKINKTHTYTINYQLSICYHNTPPFHKKKHLSIPKTNRSPLKNGPTDRLPTELLDQGHRHTQDTATNGEP